MIVIVIVHDSYDYDARMERHECCLRGCLWASFQYVSWTWNISCEIVSWRSPNCIREMLYWNFNYSHILRDISIRPNSTVSSMKWNSQRSWQMWVRRCKKIAKISDIWHWNTLFNWITFELIRSDYFSYNNLENCKEMFSFQDPICLEKICHKMQVGDDGIHCKVEGELLILTHIRYIHLTIRPKPLLFSAFQVPVRLLEYGLQTSEKELQRLLGYGRST